MSDKAPSPKEESIVEHPLPEGVQLAAFPTPGFDPLRDRSQDDRPPSVRMPTKPLRDREWADGHPEDLYDDLPLQAKRILEDILPGVTDRFVAKNKSYELASENLAEMLGAKGQWGDLFRKIMVTKQALWDGQEALLLRSQVDMEGIETESVEERLEDIVGHALLAIDMLRQGNRG